MATTDWDAYRKELDREKFNQQIQLANSQQQASRNAQKTLNAQGYGSQGYGASQQAQINNDYRNSQADLQNQYFNSLLKIDQKEQEEIENNANNTFQTFITDTQGLTGDDFYSRAESYGLAVKNGSGQYVLNTNSDVYKNLDQASQAYLQNYFKTASAEPLPYGNANIFDASSFDNQVTYANKDGQTVSDSINNKFKNETETVLNNIRNGTIKDGDMIKMTNNSDGGSVYLIYDNGNLYYITEDYFNSGTGNKYTTYGEERTLKNYSTSSGNFDMSSNPLIKTAANSIVTSYQEDINPKNGDAVSGNLEAILNMFNKNVKNGSLINFGNHRFTYRDGKWYW